ncbi:MAG: Spi family protease inhibitor [Muribaculaceae bacterium]|nr:Spi family protease inhibitor [Muribaculaceae bacterium]
MRPIKKILLTMAVCGLMPAGGHLLHAETIGQKEAKAMAQKFFNESRNYVTPPVTYVYNGKDLTTQRLFTPFYVFNSPSGGFVVVSAENKAFPILAYSLKENFDKDRISPMTREILSDFSRDIELIRYDSRIPSDAMEQWISYPEVVFDMLKNPDNNDYYAVAFSDGGESFWMVRREATEFDFETEEPVEYAFAPAEAQSVILPETPLVTSNIAGHFALTLPMDIERVVVYDVTGMMVENRKYRNTNVAHIDLAAHPNGFYVALVIDVHGVGHAVKLYR